MDNRGWEELSKQEQDIAQFDERRDFIKEKQDAQHNDAG